MPNLTPTSLTGLCSGLAAVLHLKQQNVNQNSFPSLNIYTQSFDNLQNHEATSLGLQPSHWESVLQIFFSFFFLVWDCYIEAKKNKMFHTVVFGIIFSEHMNKFI